MAAAAASISAQLARRMQAITSEESLRLTAEPTEVKFLSGITEAFTGKLKALPEAAMILLTMGSLW